MIGRRCGITNRPVLVSVPMNDLVQIGVGLESHFHEGAAGAAHLHLQLSKARRFARGMRYDLCYEGAHLQLSKLRPLLPPARRAQRTDLRQVRGASGTVAEVVRSPPGQARGLRQVRACGGIVAES
jgi:hypothetical protein